jgi:hypothetical protein
MRNMGRVARFLADVLIYGAFSWCQWNLLIPVGGALGGNRGPGIVREGQSRASAVRGSAASRPNPDALV